MCIDDLPGTPYAQFAVMNKNEYVVLKKPDAKLGVIYKVNLKKEEKNENKNQ